jgi:hypothetical protein
MAILTTGALDRLGAWVMVKRLATGERTIVDDLGASWRMRILVGAEHLRDGDPALREDGGSVALERDSVTS